MSDRDEAQKLQLAFSLHRNQKFSEAAKLYREIIKRNSRNVHALASLGVIEGANGNLTEAGSLLSRALSLQPTNLQFIENHATVQYRLGNYTAALESSLKGCSIDRTSKSLLHLSASSLFKLGQWQESLLQFDKILALEPNHIAALNERSQVLLALKQHDAALAGIEKIISLNPGIAEVHLNKGILCGELKRYGEAIAAFETALKLKPGLAAAWHGFGKVLFALHRYVEALTAYDKALALDPKMEAAWLGRGNVLAAVKRHLEALECYGRALLVKPKSAEALLGRGTVFHELKRYHEALSSYEMALGIKADLEMAWLNLGNVYVDLKRYNEAVASFDKALAIKPDLVAAAATRFHSKMRICDWEDYSAGAASLLESVGNNMEGLAPLVFLGVGSTAEEQLHCASLWVQQNFPLIDPTLWNDTHYTHDKIRIAYMSADFRQHPVAYLIAGIFESHDRSQFEITGISIGADDGSDTRRRLEVAFDKFIDARALSSDDFAKKIREAEIDILIDLNGFTENARTDVLARRPAPIQVNYLGYPGTMGASYIDYIVGDPTLIPASQQESYSEKVVYLPDSYLPHDIKSRVISDRSFERSEFHLPEESFIFCCFNNAYKLNPDIFRSWVRILKAVEGSVLWLSENNALAAANLRKEAISLGLDPQRLVFARRLPSSADHLARHRLADLFLDTLPYNAHTTASDALWAGLPVLTQIGETFAGRVAASLLNVLGLPELIAATQEEYERKAIDLARHPEKLAAIRDRLGENRRRSALFDTAAFTRHLEAAYIAMLQRHQAGLAPDHIIIPN